MEFHKSSRNTQGAAVLVATPFMQGCSGPSEEPVRQNVELVQEHYTPSGELSRLDAKLTATGEEDEQFVDVQAFCVDTESDSTDHRGKDLWVGAGVLMAATVAPDSPACADADAAVTKDDIPEVLRTFETLVN